MCTLLVEVHVYVVFWSPPDIWLCKKRYPSLVKVPKERKEKKKDIYMDLSKIDNVRAHLFLMMLESSASITIDNDNYGPVFHL